jgi:hypothetical protein
MIRSTPAAPPLSGLFIAAILVLLLAMPQAVCAQGLVKGMQDGAQVGNKAAGPVGGVLGGAIGGVVGVFNGALGVGGEKGQEQSPPAAATAKPIPSTTSKPGKATKTAKATAVPTASSGKPVEVLTQPGVPQLTAEQIGPN